MDDATKRLGELREKTSDLLLYLERDCRGMLTSEELVQEADEAIQALRLLSRKCGLEYLKHRKHQ